MSVSNRLEELAAPYYIWKKKGYSVTVASIKGESGFQTPASLAASLLGICIDTPHHVNIILTVVMACAGGQIPLDPMSLKDDYLTEHSKTFLDSGEWASTANSSTLNLPFRPVLCLHFLWVWKDMHV